MMCVCVCSWVDSNQILSLLLYSAEVAGLMKGDLIVSVDRYCVEKM